MRAAVSALFLMNGFIVGSWAPLVPEVAARHGLSETQMGLMILALGLGSLFVMPLSGALIARIGTLPVLRATSVVCGLVILPVALAPNVGVLVAALFVFGGIIGSMDIAMNSNAVVVERRLTRAIMSSCHGFWSLGGLCGAVSGGVLIDWMGISGQAIVVCVISLALALACFNRLAPDLPLLSQDKPRFRLSLAPMPYLLGLVALFSMVPEGAILDWGALYLRQDLGADVTYSGLAFGAVAAEGGSAAIEEVAGAEDAGLSGWVGFALAGIGIANLVPVVFSAAGNLPDLPPGVGISIATSMGYSGILLAPALIGFVAEHNGFSVAFMGLAALFAVVLMLSAIVHPADLVAPAEGAAEPL